LLKKDLQDYKTLEAILLIKEPHPETLYGAATNPPGG
jgi:hypothetical protein